MGFANEVGIDLGTANVLVYIKGKGIVLSEPSVVAINNDTDEILAVGEEARQMLGRTPSNIVAIRPLRDGVVSDYDITERMLKYLSEKLAATEDFLSLGSWYVFPAELLKLRREPYAKPQNRPEARTCS